MNFKGKLSSCFSDLSLVEFLQLIS